MTTWQQVMLWLLIIIGSSIWVSIWTILVRKHAFERRFREIVRRDNERPSSRGGHHHHRHRHLALPLTERLRSLGKGQARPAAAADPEQGPAIRDAAAATPAVGPKPVDGRPTAPGAVTSTTAGGDGAGEKRTTPPARTDHVVFVVGDPERGKAMSTSTSTSVAPESGPVRRQAAAGASQDQDQDQDQDQQQQPSPPGGGSASFLRHGRPPRDKVGRNAQFHDLTSEERESLGGTEYRALKLLAVLVPAYWLAWQLAGSVALGAWIARYQPGPARDNAIDPWWNGVFNGVSAFNNSGMTVLDANVVPYGGSYFVLVVMGAMILAGNTAYPIFLRLVLWAGLRALRAATCPGQLAEWKATLEYILRYPRRVYTNLFPARQTWWLLFMLFVLNGTDWVAYEVLNFGNVALEQTPLGTRVIDGLFQALGTYSENFAPPFFPPPFPPPSLPPSLPAYVSSWLADQPTTLFRAISRTIRRVLRRADPDPLHRAAGPLRHHDVHLRVPGRDHDAALQRLRGAIARHLRGRQVRLGG